MSAFVVGHDHIDALLSYAIEHKLGYYDPILKDRVYFTEANATDHGRALLKENERSVGHRYGETDPTDMPGTIGQNSRNYVWHQWEGKLTAVSILKACDCFDYQACETDDYEASGAYRIIDAIRGAAGRRTPGYDDAPGWEFRRKPKQYQSVIPDPIASIRIRH